MDDVPGECLCPSALADDALCPLQSELRECKYGDDGRCSDAASSADLDACKWFARCKETRGGERLRRARGGGEGLRTRGGGAGTGAGRAAAPAARQGGDGSSGGVGVAMVLGLASWPARAKAAPI